ncbi:MAG: LysR family transcriptional regulator [Rhizobacter sp.]
MKSLAIDDFELVIRLADSLSLAAVARERNGPSSQVSRALARIEATSGIRLFHRTTHGLSLTDEGSAFLEHAHRVVAAAQGLNEELASRTGSVSGSLRISVSAILAECVLMPALAHLAQTYPALHITLNITDQMVDMATSGVDVAIRAGIPPRDTCIATRLGGHRRKLYASRDYLRSHGMPATLEDLRGHRLISNSAVARQNQWHFLRDGQPLTLSVKGQTQADNTAAVLSLALCDMGIARLNDVVAAPLVAEGALVTVLDDIADPTVHEIHAVTLAARHSAARIRLTMKWLEGCFAAFEAYR